MITNLLRGITRNLTSQPGRPQAASRMSGMASDRRLGAGRAVMGVSEDSAQPVAPQILSGPSPVQEGGQPFPPTEILDTSVNVVAYPVDHPEEILPRDMLPILPKRIRLTFFGPTDCVTCRAAFVKAVSASSLSMLGSCQYSRQRNSANGVPFLVLSIRKERDIKKIWESGMTSFIHGLNLHLKGSKCRLAVADQTSWMMFPPNDARNTVQVAPSENAELETRNQFAVLSEINDAEPGEEMLTTSRVGAGIHTKVTASATVTRKERGKFKAGSLNVRGLKIASQIDKASDIGAVLRNKGVNICAVQETWLDPAIDEITLPGYRFVGSAGYATCTRLGGGTGFLIGDELMANVETLSWKSKLYAQATWVRVRGSKRSNHLILASVYVPPVSDTRTSAEVAVDFANLTNDIAHWSMKGEVLVCGDFNARIGNSEDESGEKHARVPRFGEHVLNTEGRVMIQLMNQCDLFSLGNRFGPDVNFTCLRAQGNSVVDYLLGSEALLKCARSVTHHPLDDDTDHVLLCIDIPGKLEKRSVKPQTSVRWRLQKFENDAVAQAFREIVSAEAGAVTTQLTMLHDDHQGHIDTIAGQVNGIILEAASCTIGKKLSKGRCTAPWWTSEYKDLRVESQKAYEVAMRSKSPKDWDAFVVIRKDKNALRRKLKTAQAKADEQSTAQVWETENGSKKAWRSAKSLRDSRAGYSCKKSAACLGIHDSEGEFITDPCGIAQAFKAHYSKLASPSDNGSFLEDHRIKIEADVRNWETEGREEFQPELDTEFTEAEFEAAIERLPLHKSADSEDIVGEFIRNGGKVLQKLLLSLINLAWEKEKVPHIWGTGIVVSLYKAGDSTDPGNYRGITLISIIRKLFSTMVRLRLEKKVALHESQCAFRHDRSCIDHIFTMAQLVHESGATNRALYAFFLDIKKAYDVVWREGLFYKLMEKGVKGKMWRVLLDLFSKSNSSVRIAGEMSDSFPLKVGVGQGDPLSTLLFDIYIDDLLESLHSEGAPGGILISEETEIRALTFADDVACLNHDANGLQRNINHVAQWLQRWRMQANTRKSVVMVFNPQEGQSAAIPSEHRQTSWTMDGHTLSQVESFKYLGVWFSENGSWDLHASKALGKMKAALGYWRPLLACHRIPIRTRTMMMQTLIYSSGLYGSEVWSTPVATRQCFDVVAKDAIRTIMGLHRHEVASDVLFADIGILPPSMLMDAAKQCYHRHLFGLLPARWCKQAGVCHFYGHRQVGRPRAGTNWQGEVQKVRGDMCHDLNISDIFTAAHDQKSVRRVSQRNNRTIETMAPVQIDMEETHECAARQAVLDNLWQWMLQGSQAKYEETLAIPCPWQWNCIRDQPRGLAKYLSSLPSLKARLIMSARSGKLFALQNRLKNQIFQYVPHSELHCCECNERLGNACTACVHCAVDCPVLWPKLDHFFEVVQSMGEPGGALASKLESVLGVDLITEMLTLGKVVLPKELTGAYWSAVADLFACQNVDAEDKSGQGSVSQAMSGALESGVVVTSLISQVALGDANVHVDAVVL